MGVAEALPAARQDFAVDRRNINSTSLLFFPSYFASALNRTSNTTMMTVTVSRVLFMICSMLLLMQPSTAQESSTASSPAPLVRGEGESDVTGKSSSGQSAVHRLRLACTHATRSFEDLFQINNMEDVYMDFRRDFESSENTVSLHNKADTSEETCMLL